jgi:hypothetical protein
MTPVFSFDHVIGTSEKCWWNLDSNCCRGPLIDDEFEFRWCLDRQLARRFAPKDAVNVSSRSPILIREINAICH